MSVILEFIGNTNGAQIFRHPVTKRNIRAGRNLAVRYVTVEQDEVDYFLAIGLFRVAHSGSQVSVKRKDAPVRIEPTPIVDESPVVDEAPTENVVSFDESQVESLVDWLSEPKASVAEEVDSVQESVETAEVPPAEVEASDAEQKSDKVRRGRPRG